MKTGKCSNDYGTYLQKTKGNSKRDIKNIDIKEFNYIKGVRRIGTETNVNEKQQ